MTHTFWIVDDDEDDRYFARYALLGISANHSIKEFTDGDQVLPALNEVATLPNLILLDLNMHRMNGFDTLLEVRNLPAYLNLPIVILTMSNFREDRDRSMELGATDFITKQNTPQTLQALLKQKLGTWRLN